MESEQPFKKEQVQGMIKEFLCLDADGDGTITVDELEKVLRSMRAKSKPSEIDIKNAIKEIDKNGDGTIDMDEYVRSCRNKATQDLIHRALVQSSKIRKEFEKFDKDNSGFITKEELMEVIQARASVTISPKQIDQMMIDSDENNDGLINYEEFILLMTK